MPDLGTEPPNVLQRAARAIGFGRPLSESATLRDLAVVDIGSGSVRLVLYQLEGRAIVPMLNERVDAGLGKGVAETGRLSEQGVAIAERALRRFARLLDDRGVSDVIIAATAATRDAEDGPDFADKVAGLLGREVRVLSGQEEARYAAMGVLAGDPAAQGVIGDLGGSSLELAPLSEGVIGPGVTLSVGPHALDPAGAGDLRAIRKRLDAAYEAAEIARFGSARTLYLVGGAWRNLARVEMRRRNHPVAVTHGFAMSRDEARSLCARSSSGRVDPAALEGLSRRRITGMPLAALTLDRLLAAAPIPDVVVSAYGLREGLVFEAMTEAERAGDPLIAGAEAVARRMGAEPSLGRALAAWLRPLGPALGHAFGAQADARLRETACRLADISAWRHPDNRAAISFHDVLAAPVAGVSHPERAFLARAVAARYGGKRNAGDSELACGLLDMLQQDAALRLGLALRLAFAVCGRTAKLLDVVTARLEKGAVVLSVQAHDADLLEESVAKRLTQFADACGLSQRVEIG